MSGKELKEKAMQATGLGFVEIANKMGITSQALNTIFKSPDVKTSHLENLVRSLGITFDVLYPELSMHASNTQVNSGNNCKVNQTAEFYTQPHTYENTVMRHLMEMNDRLIAVIEGRGIKEQPQSNK